MIHQADTYKYDMKHFGKDTKCDQGASGECYNNVFAFAKHYKQLGKIMNIILVFGGRAWDNNNVFGFHYLLQDANTGEYIDPQYRRYTFFPVHQWTVEEYKVDMKEFKKRFGYKQAEEFAAWYCDKHKDYVEAGSLMVRAMADYRKPSKKVIQERMKICCDVIKPQQGKCLVKMVIFD